MTHSTNIAEKKNISDYLLSFLRNKHGAVSAAAVLLFFGIVVFGIYSRTLESPFVFDDLPRIKENPYIRLNHLSFKEILEAGFKSSKTRPVAFISFALNYYFDRYDPAGYHVVNLCIHIFAGFFLFLFIRTTLKLPSLQNRFAHPDLIALGAALIWLVHPVQTQSVTYIVQRMNSMASLLFVASFWLYVKGRVAENGSRKWLWYSGAIIAWLVSLGCKQITLTLPFLVLLYEWYFFQNLSKEWLKRRLKWCVPVLALLILIGLIYTNFSPLEKISKLKDFANNEFTLAERALTQLRVVVYYISLLFYPHPSRLNLDYDFPLSYSLINPFTTLPSLALILGLIALGIILAKSRRLMSFCIFWFLSNLVLESSVIPLAIIFEHRLYLPSMLAGLVPILVLYRYSKPQWVAVVICGLLIGIFSYWTFERNEVWRDAETLWADCVKKSPDKARPYTNLGKALLHKKRFDEALDNLLKAIQIDPNYIEARLNLGFVYETNGDTDKAIEQYRKAIQINPSFAKAYNNLGVSLLKQDKTDEAIQNIQKALQLDPGLAAAYMNMGTALAEQNKFEAAIEYYNKALQINPNIARVQFLLGDALLKQGRADQGIQHLKIALQIDPDYDEALNNLGGQLLQQGKIDEALAYLNRALEINPDLAQAHNNVGIIMIQKGNLDAAISNFQEALRIAPEFEMAKNNLQRALAIRQNKLDGEVDKLLAALRSRPDDAVLNYRLGNLYLGKGELTGAVRQFEKALALQPEFPEAQNNLALAYAAERQYDRALAAFKKLVELEPDNPSTYYNIAVLYALQNHVDDALGWLKKAVEKGYRNWELIKTDKDLANVRHSEDYKQLIKGH
jgi:tetratricopeptide (TPR) repeat protein